MFLGQSTITPSPWIKSCKGLLGFALFADKFFMSVATFDVHPCNQFYTLNSIFSMLFSGFTKTLMSRNACNGENGENSPGSGDLNWMPKVAPWRLAILAKLAILLKITRGLAISRMWQCVSHYCEIRWAQKFAKFTLMPMKQMFTIIMC